MEVDKKKSEEAVKKGVLLGFIPHRLLVEGRDELCLFPFNIMFARYRGETDGSTTMGSAVYDPDFPTFKREGDLRSMVYRNKYGGDSHVVITVDTVKRSYSGDKFVNGVRVGVADGIIKEDIEKSWEMFFVHLTMLGLSNGEQCKFEPVKSEEKNT